VISTHDPGRFYITSSMSNFTHFDSDYALAPKDGNYGINAPETYFQRNPGLIYPNGSRMDCPISFQPEIGVRKTFFCPMFMLKPDHFAKTGSGQTWQKLRKKTCCASRQHEQPDRREPAAFHARPCAERFPELRPSAKREPQSCLELAQLRRLHHPR
jgi:hypothetical protein